MLEVSTEGLPPVPWRCLVPAALAPAILADAGIGNRNVEPAPGGDADAVLHGEACGTGAAAADPAVEAAPDEAGGEAASAGGGADNADEAAVETEGTRPCQSEEGNGGSGDRNVGDTPGAEGAAGDGFCTASEAASDDEGSAISVLDATRTPGLSDRIVAISGALEQRRRGLRKVLRTLRAAQGAGADDAAAAPLVVLVPSLAAPVVVGTKGRRVLALMERCGAKVEVSREVLVGLAVQPVTITGNLEQVVAGVEGVQEAVQELAARGRLSTLDLEFHGVGPAAGTSAAAAADAGSELRRPPAGAAVFVVPLDVAGFIVGKQGRRIAALQHATGARISVPSSAGGRGTLPGMRCGDRLVEVAAPDARRRDAGVRAVLETIREAGPSPSTPSTSSSAGRRPPASAASGKAPTATLLVAYSAVGYLIGKGGQTVKELMGRLGVDVVFRQDAQRIAGNIPVDVDGPPVEQADAVLELLAKVDELRARLLGVGSESVLGGAGAVGVICGGSSGAVAWEAAAARQARPGGALGALVGGAALPGAWRTPRTSQEEALLAGIQASGVLNNQLTLRVPRSALARLDAGELARRSGARLEVAAPTFEDPDHCFVTLVGQRLSTALAALYVQEEMARLAAQ